MLRSNTFWSYIYFFSVSFSLICYLIAPTCKVYYSSCYASTSCLRWWLISVLWAVLMFFLLAVADIFPVYGLGLRMNLFFFAGLYSPLYKTAGVWLELWFKTISILGFWLAVVGLVLLEAKLLALFEMTYFFLRGVRICVDIKKNK